MQTQIFLLFALYSLSSAFIPSFRARHSPQRAKAFISKRLTKTLKMVEITSGVEFDTVAREWRFKWSQDNDKASLASAQTTLKIFESEIKAIPGVKSIQRVVCGGCLDFKVITALEAESFGAWEQKQFAPEENFLAAIKAIPGVSQVETQTFTLMPV